MARRERITSLSAFLNDLRHETKSENVTIKLISTYKKNYLIARYIGRTANSGRVYTRIMINMNIMYRMTLMNPKFMNTLVEFFSFSFMEQKVKNEFGTYGKFCIQQEDGFILPGIFTVDIVRMEGILNGYHCYHSQ